MQPNSIRHVARIPLLRSLRGHASNSRHLAEIVAGHALVDDIDAKYLSQFRWRICIDKRTSYAFRATSAMGRSYRHQMHGIVWERHFGPVPADYTLDHIDHDGLNNQIANLRLATHAQQIRNQKPHRRNTSGYRGVNWNSTCRMWYATVRHDEHYFLGRYAIPEEAAIAYNHVAARISGEHAWLNPIPEGIVSEERKSEIIAVIEDRYIPRIERISRELTEWTHTLNADGTPSTGRVSRHSTTGYRGVSKWKKNDRYRAVVRHKDRIIFLGQCPTAEEAAIAYNHSAPIFFGDKARINTIPEGAVSEGRRRQITTAIDSHYLPQAGIYPIARMPLQALLFA